MQRVGVVAMALIVFLEAGCSSKDEPEPNGPPPPPDVEVVRPLTLTDAARVPENDPSWSGVEIYADRVVLLYDAQPTLALEPGNVIAGATGSGYLRRVKMIGDYAGGRMEVATEPAYLTDFIADGAFRVRTHRDAIEWAESDGIVGGRAAFLESGLSIFTPATARGLSCAVMEGGAPVQLMPIFDIDLELEIEVDISLQGTLPPVPTLDHALFAASGGLRVGLEIRAPSGVRVSCTRDIIAFLRNRAGNPNLFRLALPAIRFAIGPVPVVITHFIDPIFSIELGVETTFAEAQASGTLAFGVRAGAEKVNGAWRGIWEPTQTGAVVLRQPDELGEISANLQVSAGTQYAAFLYDLAGPFIGITSNVGAGFSLDPNSCVWEGVLYAGGDLGVGATLQIPALDYTLASWSTSFSLDRSQIEFGSGTWDSLCAPDAGVPDAEPEDAEPPDAEPEDAGVADGAEGDGSDEDGAIADAEAIDAAACGDGGTPDAGAPGASTSLYYVDRSTLYKANLDGSGAAPIATGLDGSRQLAVDAVGRKIYWTTPLGLKRANLDGSGVEVVYGGHPVAVAVDGAARKIYWTDLGEQKIRRANTDGSCVEDLASTGALPDGVAVDPAGGMVYFTETINGGTEVSIQRVPVTGGAVQPLLVRPSYVQAWIGVDPMGAMIYWGEIVAGSKNVSRAGLDGSGPTPFVSGLARDPWGLAVDPAGGHVYWTQWASGNMGMLRRAALAGGGDQPIVTGLQYPLGVAVGPGN